MAQKSIKKTANRRQDYISFLNQVIEICLEFAKNIGTDSKTLFFREKGANQEWYETRGDGWVNDLCACVYDAIASGTNVLEITQYRDGDAEDEISFHNSLQINQSHMLGPQNESAPETLINEVLDRFQSGFVDREIADRLKNDSETFFQTRRHLLTRKSVFHLKRDEIKSYLRAYYAFLRDILLFYNEFDWKQDRDSLINALLCLDVEYDKEYNVYHLNFWMPIALNKIQKVNDGIADFFNQITSNKAAMNKWLRQIYKHIVLIKALHEFRWYIPGQNHELQHAAIPPYVDNHSADLKFQIDTRSPKLYSSYEGINELRLAEKILYEYELASSKHCSVFTVAILGDIHAKPTVELYEYVYKKIGRPNEDFTLKFNIYTQNDNEVFENSQIINHGCTDKVLLNKEELEQVIDANNVVFILDCVGLYKSPELQKENHDFVKHKFAFKQYDAYNAWTEMRDVSDKNMLEELYEVMTCEQIFGRFGKIAKQANESLLHFCEEKQKQAGLNAAIFVYVSDMKAFDSIYYNDQYYIRTERYNQKEIGIIRYSSEKVTKLAVGGKNDKMLVFTIWQFIKNVALDERNMLISHVEKAEYAYMNLDQIYIGIDYKNWPSLLEVHYYSEEPRYEKVALKFIKDILLPVLNNRNKDMFNQYIRKAMHSFFFSAAKSVNDMLFTHLFSNKENLLGAVIQVEENNPQKVKDNINIKAKYSSKRFYEMIMKNYDMSSNIYVGQTRTSHIIQKSEEKEKIIQKTDIYQNVITSCNNLSYEDAYLVKNCELELKGRY